MAGVTAAQRCCEKDELCLRVRPLTMTHTCRLVDGTSMNEECVAVDAVGSIPKIQPRVDRQVCAVRFLT